MRIQKNRNALANMISEHGVIDPFIQNLTGIRNSQVKKAPRIEEALATYDDWIGDREHAKSSCLERFLTEHSRSGEIKSKEDGDERFWILFCEARWIDYQMYL